MIFNQDVGTSLYISESNQGKIWRITYNGDKEKSEKTELSYMEKRKTMNYIRRPHEVLDNLQQGDLFSGRILYNTYCVACHQSDGKGDNSRFPSLVDSEWLTGDEDRLVDVILNGLQGEIEVNGRLYNEVMPPLRHLDDNAIASIATYIRKRFAGMEGAPLKAENVRQVREATSDGE